MNIIGLTGGSGAGKSTVAHFFAARGAGWVDADAVYHRLCRENRAMLAELSAAFGDVLGADGTLDRSRLAPIVFSGPDKLALLDGITTPYIRAASCAAFDACALRCADAVPVGRGRAVYGRGDRGACAACGSGCAGDGAGRAHGGAGLRAH